MLLQILNSSQKNKNSMKREKLLFLKNQELISENTKLAECIALLSAELENEINIRNLIDKIGESLDLDEILTNVVNRVANLTKSDRCIIYLAEQKDTKTDLYNEFRIQENKNFISENLALYRLYDDYYESIVTDDKTRIIENIDLSLLNYKQKQYFNYYKIKSLIITPICHNKELLGLVVIHQRDWLCDWHDAHSESLKKISNQAAISIKHAILYTRLTQETELNSKNIKDIPVEFKNHITSLIGFSDLLLKQKHNKLTDKQEQYLNNIVETTDLLNKAINNKLGLL